MAYRFSDGGGGVALTPAKSMGPTDFAGSTFQSLGCGTGVSAKNAVLTKMAPSFFPDFARLPPQNLKAPISQKHAFWGSAPAAAGIAHRDVQRISLRELSAGPSPGPSEGGPKRNFEILSATGRGIAHR